MDNYAADTKEARKTAKQGSHWLVLQPGREPTEHVVLAFRGDRGHGVRAQLRTVATGETFWANTATTLRLLAGALRG